MDECLERLKKEYNDIPIPDELEFVVKKALKKGPRRTVFLKWLVVAGMAALIFVTTINLSPSVAQAFSTIPGVGSLIKVLTIKEYVVENNFYDAKIEVPAVQNLKDKTLELGLNEKYLAENKALYDQFQKEMNDLKAAGDGHLGVNAGYEIKTDTENILVIARYVVNKVGSSSTKMKYDTIDKKNEILLTLPMLFKDDQYIERISGNIIQQMKDQMKAYPDKKFWVDKQGEKSQIEPFTRIKANQNFYINADSQLVISFNKYDVAPGYMGVQEFVIPAEVISDLLVSYNYVK